MTICEYFGLTNAISRSIPKGQIMRWVSLFGIFLREPFRHKRVGLGIDLRVSLNRVCRYENPQSLRYRNISTRKGVLLQDLPRQHRNRWVFSQSFYKIEILFSKELKFLAHLLYNFFGDILIKVKILFPGWTWLKNCPKLALKKYSNYWTNAIQKWLKNCPKIILAFGLNWLKNQTQFKNENNILYRFWSSLISSRIYNFSRFQNLSLHNKNVSLLFF